MLRSMLASGSSSCLVRSLRRRLAGLLGIGVPLIAALQAGGAEDEWLLPSGAEEGSVVVWKGEGEPEVIPVPSPFQVSSEPGDGSEGTPAAGAGPGYVPGEIIVKFRSEGASAVSGCVDCALAAGAPWSRETTDRSNSLDLLRERFRVRAARPLLREQTGRSLRDSRARMAARLRALQARRPARARRARAAADMPDLSSVYVLKVDPAVDPRVAAAHFARDSHVEYAHPNFTIEAFLVPNDPFYSSGGSWGQAAGAPDFLDLWGLRKLQTEAVWDQTRGAGVVVAVVDTGVDIAHPDLASSIWVNPGEVPGNGIDDDGNGFVDDVNGWDFFGSLDANGDGDFDDPGDLPGDNDPEDAYGHGTHVAGTIAAAIDNGVGIVGVAPEAKILPVRALGPNGAGFTADLAAALAYAALNGADVINNSWGCSICPEVPLFEDVVRLAHDLGAVVVFAAGNSSDDAAYRSPQNMSETITVSALTASDEPTSFTSFGAITDVGAPGGGVGTLPENILSLNVVSNSSLLAAFRPDLVVAGDYLRLNGTSMATPHVSGAAALLLAADPSLSPEQIRQLLRLSADPIGATGGEFFGYGRIDVLAALGESAPLDLQVDTPSPRSIADPVVLTGSVTGPGAQSVQLAYGTGASPSSFVDLATSYDAATGAVSGSFDPDLLADGPTLVRLRASDGARTFESTTTVFVDNVQIVSPQPFDVVSGVIDLELELGVSPLLTRVTVKAYSVFEGTDVVFYDQAGPFPASLTIPVDTTLLHDTVGTQCLSVACLPTLVVETEFTLGSEIHTAQDTLPLQLDNGVITSPERNALFTSLDPITLTGQSALDWQLQLVDRHAELLAVLASGTPGAFSVAIDPSDAVFGISQGLSTVAYLRLIGDHDRDGLFEAQERDATHDLYFDASVQAGWPQNSDERALPGAFLGVGRLGSDARDDIVLLQDSRPSAVGTPLDGVIAELTPVPQVYAWDGFGNRNDAVRAGSLGGPVTQCALPGLGDVDGDPASNEIVYASWGELVALAADGSIPPGFAPEVYNDSTLDPARHADPNERDLKSCYPVVPYPTLGGSVRLLNGFWQYDTEASLFLMPGVQATHLRESSLTAFDGTGAVAEQVDFGPGTTWNVRPLVADLDGDGELEIASAHVVPGNPGVVQIRVVAADGFSSEAFIEVPIGLQPAPTSLVAGDLDGDGDLEIVVPLGNGNVRDLYAFHHDGSVVAGFPVTVEGEVSVALGDLDLDGRAEIVYTTGVPSLAFSISMKNLRVDRNVKVTALRYDPVAGQTEVVPGWPGEGMFTASTLRIADIDADPEPEVFVVERDYDIVSIFGESVPSLFFYIEATHYRIHVYDPDGSPWQGGFARDVRGRPDFAIANVDDDPEAELVMAYGVYTGELNAASPEWLKSEVLVDALPGSFRQSASPWAQDAGNARHTNAVPDGDGDGIPDQIDNCLAVPNGPGEGSNNQCDTDADGFGNACDGDFDRDGDVDATDFNPVFLDDYTAGTDSGAGTDMNCDGVVNGVDFGFFLPVFTSGMEDASALACADSTGATAPCVVVHGPGDADADGVVNFQDSCVVVKNGPAQAPNDQSCDTDLDGFGNACDGDFDQDGDVDLDDFDPIFLDDFAAGTDSGVGTDMNCNGIVTSIDFSAYFLPQFSFGVPGPSGSQ